jgi:hypothetical protein
MGARVRFASSPGALSLVALLIVVVLAGCRSGAEFLGFTGSPEGHDGWSHDYNATPQDTWEAFRLVVRDNGEITREDPHAMELEGIYRPHDSRSRDGINIRGRVYDRSSENELRSRLIVRAWYERAANNRERPHTAQEYCNTVHRVLLAWRGQTPGERPSVDTTSEEPVQQDEAIGFFRVTPAQAFAVCESVVREYGAVDQADAGGGFIRGKKINPLERETQDVRVNIYDRTEGENVRVKVSVRVVGPGGRPMQEVARAYVAEIRDRLQKQLETQE